MFKRQRLEETPDTPEDMEVEIYGKEGKPDIIQRLGETDPKILQLLHDIMPTNQVELVEKSDNPLGVSPVGKYRKLIDGEELVELASGIQLSQCSVGGVAWSVAFMIRLILGCWGLVCKQKQADNQAKYKIANKLEMIAEQIQFLRQQAYRVIKDGQESLSLNHVACNFRKVPGNTYYVYRKPSGQVYFSVLSPLDWQGKPPHEYCGSYKYRYDHTWSRSEQFHQLLAK